MENKRFIALYDGQGYDDRYEILNSIDELVEHKQDTAKFLGPNLRGEDRWSYYKLGGRT